MSITANCPHCHQTRTFDESLTGRVAVCHGCNQSFTLPTDGQNARRMAAVLDNIGNGILTLAVVAVIGLGIVVLNGALTLPSILTPAIACLGGGVVTWALFRAISSGLRVLAEIAHTSRR